MYGERYVLDAAQEGKQRQFLESDVDIAIYGGAAGGGKTYAMLLEPLKHVGVEGFGSVILRRIRPSITVEGGMWDVSQGLYNKCGGDPRKGDLSWTFPAGTSVTFSGIQYDEDVKKYQGGQIPLIGFDQLEEFTEKQFFFMFSRNRSTCGVKPYIRATANPQPGWLAEFLDWWIAEDGYADLDRAGKIRWMVRVGERIEWASSKEELIKRFPDSLPKSVTFIPSTVYDNKILLDADPGYLANLQALPTVDRERLLGDRKRGGNWKIKPAAGKIYNRNNYMPLVYEAPDGGVDCLYWDLAATPKDFKAGQDPSYTACVLMRYVNSEYYVRFVFAEQLSPAQVDARFKRISSQFYKESVISGVPIMIRWEEEPGSASKRETVRLAKMLPGADAKGDRVGVDKFIRGRPFAAASVVGNVFVVNADWSETWLDHMHNQPEIKEMDIHDSTTGAFNALSGKPVTRKARSYSGW